MFYLYFSDIGENYKLGNLPDAVVIFIGFGVGVFGGVIMVMTMAMTMPRTAMLHTATTPPQPAVNTTKAPNTTWWVR